MLATHIVYFSNVKIFVDTAIASLLSANVAHRTKSISINSKFCFRTEFTLPIVWFRVQQPSILKYINEHDLCF